MKIRRQMLLFLVMILISLHGKSLAQESPEIWLGADVLIPKYHQWLDGKNIGVITDFTGVNEEGKSIVDLLRDYPETRLKAIYTLEFGLGGQAEAGEDVESYKHPEWGLPVFNLFNKTSLLTEEMLKDIDVLIFDIQDIGDNSYIPSLHDVMTAAQKYKKEILVLDRPNPLGGGIVTGPLLSDSYPSLAGTQNIPIEHGMTIGELAFYFNREIGSKLTVVPMKGYTRSMLPEDTSLEERTSMEAKLADDLQRFKEERERYLLYGDVPRVHLSGGLIWNKKSYVPLESVLTELGYTVGTDTVTESVYAIKPEKTVVFKLGKEPQIIVNDVLIQNDEILPLVKEDIIYIPAQFIPWIEKSKQQTVGNTIQIRKADQEVFVSIPPKTKPVQPNSSGKIAYLTFDDGPSVQTPHILDILKENGVQATFFVVGKNIKGREEIVKRAAEEGNVIGNHTFTHNYNSIYKTEDNFMADFDKGNAAIEQVTGIKPDIFRFPGGSNNSVSKKAQDTDIYSANQWIMKDLVQEVHRNGYAYFDWNVSTGDASPSGYTADSALQRVKEGIKGKQEVIILSHDASTKADTVKALPKIIEVLKEEGFSFGTLNHESKPYAFLQ